MRKLIKIPWKFNQSLVAKPENLKYIVITEGDDNQEIELMISENRISDIRNGISDIKNSN